MSFRSVLRQGLQIGCVLILGMVVHGDACAVQVVYEFSTTVNFVDPAASGYPSSLSGVNVNDPITGRISYEASSPAVVNPFGGIFGLATYYPLANANISIQVAGVLFDSWPGTLAAHVWNNDPTSAFPPGVFDGLLYSNITMPSQLQFKIGNIILPEGTFPNEALPNGPVTGIHSFELGLVNGGSWVRSNAFNLNQAIDEAGDYNGDGTVDAADYVVWRDTLGDPVNYNLWKAKFGTSGIDLLANATIPEPPALAILLTGMLAIAFNLAWSASNCQRKP